MTLRAPVPYSENAIVAYPVASAGIAVTAGAANVYGAYAEAMAASTITTAFRVVGVQISTPAVALDTGTISVATGGAGAEVQCLEVPYEFATDAGGFATIPVFSKTLAANARVAVRIKNTAGAATAAIRVMLQAV